MQITETPDENKRKSTVDAERKSVRRDRVGLNCETCFATCTRKSCRFEYEEVVQIGSSAIRVDSRRILYER